MKKHFKKMALCLLAVFLMATAWAQQKDISGTVSDKNGESLPGVSIAVKGTTNGTITDGNGSYSLSNIPDDAILQFSFVGMKTQEAVVGSKTKIDISLIEDAIDIDEVVAVGYATQKKVNLTGSVGTVDMKIMETRPVQNAAQMLQGVVAGLNIKQSDGQLNSNPSINIRGVATIGSGSTGNPLILIDGMEGDINSVNPQDIASISVLKDVAASSIYGSRAPFGVILIKTKTGTKGKTKINYNNSFRWSSPMNLPQMMNAFDFATYFNDAQVNSGGSPKFDATRMQRIQDYMSGKSTDNNIPNTSNPLMWSDGYNFGTDNIDWYKALYRDQTMAQEHNISASGGSEAMQYYFSGNYLDQDGFMVFNQDKYKRYTSTVKLNAKLSEKVNLNLSNRFIREDYRAPSNLNDGFFQNLARQAWPTLPLYDKNGFLFSSPSPALGLRDGGVNKTQGDWLYQQAQLVIEPINDWKIFTEMNYRTFNNLEHRDYQYTYNHDVAGNAVAYGKSSSVYEYAYRENYYNSNIYTEYFKNLKGGHYIKGMIGFQAELNKYRDLSAQRAGIIVPEMSVMNLTTGADYNGVAVTPTVNGQYQNWATTGYFGRINYNYMERYLLEVNLRYDGTSRFRADKRWKMFPSVSAGWNIAQENFWGQTKNLISVLKIRGSYGELGNQNTTGWYPTYVAQSVGTSNGTWLVGGAKPNTSSAPGLVSQTLTWERVKSWNAGLDLTMLKSRLNGTFDYFTRYTNNMVGPAPELPVLLGTAVPTTNNTDLKTYGFELELSWKDQLKNGFGYSVKFLLSDSQTEITKYPNPTQALNTYRTGQVLGEIWGYETIGIAKTQDEMNTFLATLPNGGQNAIGTKFGPGDIMYKDLNNDGKIDNGANTLNNHGDLKVIGNNSPRYTFGLDLSANWKGFDLRAFFQGIMKRDYYRDNYYFWGASTQGIWWSTGLVQHKDYFRADPNHPLGQNLNSYFPEPLMGSIATKNQLAQTRYLQDASYIRLKNLQLGYTIPESLLGKYGLSKIRFYVSGENILTITNLISIFDPETLDGGFAGNAYPLSKVFSAGLSVNF